MRQVLLTILYKTIEMIVDSEGREIKLVVGHLKGTVCIAYRSYYEGFFF